MTAAVRCMRCCLHLPPAEAAPESGGPQHQRLCSQRSVQQGHRRDAASTAGATAAAPRRSGPARWQWSEAAAARAGYTAQRPIGTQETEHGTELQRPEAQRRPEQALLPQPRRLLWRHKQPKTWTGGKTELAAALPQRPASATDKHVAHTCSNVAPTHAAPPGGKGVATTMPCAATKPLPAKATCTMQHVAADTPESRGQRGWRARQLLAAPRINYNTVLNSRNTPHTTGLAVATSAKPHACPPVLRSQSSGAYTQPPLNHTTAQNFPAATVSPGVPTQAAEHALPPHPRHSAHPTGAQFFAARPAARGRPRGRPRRLGVRTQAQPAAAPGSVAVG